MTKPLSKLWWLWIPIAILMIQLAIEVIFDEPIKAAILKEGGYHENFQALTALAASLVSFRAFRMVESKWLKIWFFLGCLGSFFIAGEELSWGQWLFEWKTPTEWAQINDQQETNLHNLSSWFDQKPFILVCIGVLVGGIFIPLLQKYKPVKLLQKFVSIYADYRVMPTALIALTLKLTDVLQNHADIKIFWRVQEILELYVFYFIFVYTLVMMDKYRQSHDLAK